MMPEMDGLKVRHLHVSYGRREVVRGVTLDTLPPGSTTALLGPNGSGKSTFLRALAGLTAARGDVVLNGSALHDQSLSERARQCAYLPQTLPPLVAMEVLEAVMVARQSGARGGRIETRLALQQSLEILDRLGIGDLALRHMDELSGGQRQLVGVAQALVRRPDMLLLDEPLSALDLRHQVGVMQIVREETRARGLITLVVLHDLNIALRHADRVVMLGNGNVLGEGPTLDIVTPELLRVAYGVNARVERCSQGLAHVVVDEIAAA